MRRYGLETMLVLAVAGCVRTPYEVERDYAGKFEPVQLEAPLRPDPAPVRTYRVRLWAERGYAAQLHWREKLERQFARVNEYLEPSFGVRLAIVDVGSWDRQTGDEDLSGALGALERQDAGEGVDWVIGLVTPLPIATATHHRMGLARYFSKYFVVRGMEDAAEARMFEKAFIRLSDAEREALYQDRKSHKELSIFVHEWAHTLGCIHASDPEGILFNEYSQHTRYIGPSCQALIEIGLKHLASGSPARDWMLAATASVQTGSHPDLDAQELQAWLGQAPSADGGVAPRPAKSTLTADDQDALKRASKLFDDHHLEEALALVRPVAERNPDDPRAQGMLCAFRIAQRAPAREIVGQCAYATELDPDNVPLLAGVALLQVELDAPHSFEALAKVRKRAMEKAAPAATWANLAGGWVRAQYVTFAEEAAERAGPVPGMNEVTDWARSTRRWLGLPPDAGTYGVSPEQEQEYLTTLREGFEAAEARKVSAAVLALQEVQKRFPKAPGTLALACGIYPVVGMWSDARRACRESVRVWDEVIPGQLGCALIAARMGAWDEARTHFERAIALDPSKEQLWTTAEDAYRKGGRAQWLADLRHRHRERFLHDAPAGP
jgi:tetratricopeptide (TPR) repeat protein